MNGLTAIEQDIDAAVALFDRPVLLTQPATTKLYRFWSDTVDRHGCFTRTDADMLNLPRSVLPHVMILEASHQKNGQIRMRYRLSGSHIDEKYGANLTGRYVDELDTREWKFFWNSACPAPIVSGNPAHGIVSIGWQDRGHIYAEFVFMPMARDESAEPNMLLCSVEFFARNDLLEGRVYHKPPL